MAPVWNSGNVWDLISVVTLCMARLVLGWVTILEHFRTTSAQNQAPGLTEPEPSLYG